MFSFAASAITLANTIANVLLNQMVARRHNMARATALGCSPLSRCILKKRKIRGKRRFWVKPGRTDLWWQNMIQNRCLEEDWRKNFRMSKNEFMKLVDELRPFLIPSPSIYRTPSSRIFRNTTHASIVPVHHDLTTRTGMGVNVAFT